MRLIAAYDTAITKGEIENNESQRDRLNALQRLTDELEQPRSWFSRWQRPSSRGIYLYGPVGAGKTYLVDLFYKHLVLEQKARFHFHHFMQQIDAQLRQRQGRKNPIRVIASELAKKTRLLCFDEFLVNDVAYALILGGLLEALLDQGVILVVTANTKPDDLYLNGVQRKRFLPTIDLIKKHCEVLSLENRKDYRLGREKLVSAYLFPLNAVNEKKLNDTFLLLVQNNSIQDNGVLTIQNRGIPFIKKADRVIWFDFKVICNLPRSQLDYLELAEYFDNILISNIPQLTEKDTLSSLLLVHLIDVLYDRGINLVISAAVPLEQLYLKGEMSQDFKRTYSRLQEMQSVGYLNRHPHRIVVDLI